MASSGNGNKFVSVNLNKSYGQQGGSGIGHPGGGRSRPGGGHGGMLVLSRPRTTQGAAGAKGSKLSVPPPLNLPSLKREHGGTDPVAQTGAATSTSAPAGWIKPATPTNISDGEQVADGLAGKPATLGSGSSWGTSVAPAARPVNPPGNTVVTSADSGGRPSVYTPPAARAKNGAPGPVSAQAPALPVMLRGEDFPSLQASLPNVTMPQQKQRDAQQKQRRNQEDLKEQKLKLQQLSQQDFPDGVLVHQQTGPESQSSPPTMRPQVRPKQHNFMGENLHFQGGDRSRGLPGQHLRKPEGYSSGPPPLVRLDHTSNWADDERDTGRSERDYVKNDHLNTDDVGYGPGTFQRNGSFPSLGPVREGRDASTFSHFEKGNFRADFNSRENWQGGNDRDASFRRSSSFRKEGNFSSDMGFDRERVFPRSANISRENIIGRNFDVENKSIRGPYGRINGQSWEADNGWENLAGRNSFGKDNGTWDSSFRDGYGRDGGYSQEGHIGSHGRDGFLRRGGEQNLAAGRYGDTIGRNRGVQNDALQNNTWNKVSFSTGSRGMPINDPILNFGRDKRSFTSYGKPYSEDPLMKDFGSIPGFDLRDPFVGGLGTEIKVTKRRKDDSKQTDFYDPIRASFEAELERVQKMQEQERQRMIEEQERAQELARQEEEERQHRAREEEERQRRLEEEARESAWRAEQQALEAARRLEEERRAREEEKRRMILEEERRKEAARRKLLELEERIAKRQAENKKEQDMPTMDEGRFLTVRSVKDRDLRRADTGDWEDEERKIDRITSSASSESSNMSRSFDTGLRAQVLRDVNSFAPDRTKPPNSWRRDLSENGNGSHFSSQIMASDQTNSYQNSNWESVNGGRGILRRDLFEGSRTGSAKIIPKIGRSETMQVNDHIPYQNDQRRFNADTEVFVNTFDGYSDIAWGQEKNDSWRGRERPRIPSPISYTQSSEADEFAIGRSRHFRQPRVLPPPSVTALQKGLCKNGSEKPFSSPLLEEEPKRGLSDHDIESKGELSLEEDCAVMNEPFEAQASQNEHGSEEQQGLINMIRSESQSLPSVSSLPSSPAHVSHDDLEEAGSPIFQQNEAEMTASSNLDGTLHNVISAEGLKSDECTEYTSPPSKSVGQEIHEEWAFEDDGDFSEEEEYEEEHLYEEEDGIFEEEEENPEKKYDYNSLHSEHQKIEVKNDQELCNTKVELEVPVLTNLEEKTVLDGIGDSSEFHGNHDGSVHQELSLEGQNLVMVAEDNEHKLQENEVPGTQHEGSIDDKEGSDIVQQPVMQQPLVHQSPMEGTSGLASMEPLQIESDMQNSMQSLVQPPQFSLSSTHLSLPQSNISSATTSLGSSILAPISALPGQTELPFKLQFGLFPGTSIQIGSIQMPLHLHPHVFPSLTQIPPSQPTVFEFGQLRYPAPIQPPIPYVHPSVSAHFSLGQPVMPLSTQHILDSAIQNLSVREQQQNNISGNQAESMTPGLRSSHVNQHASAEENTLQESRGNMDKDQLSRNKFFKSGLAFKSNAGQYRSSSSMAVDNEQIKSSKYASEVETPVVNKIYKPFTNVPVISEQGQSEGTLVQSSSGGLQTGGRGRGNRTSYGVRTDGLRTSTNTSEALWSVSADARRPHKQGRRNVHRSEFRVSVDRRQLEVLDSNNLPRKEDKSRRYVQSDSGSSSMVRGAQKDLVLSAEKSMKLEIGSKAGYGTSLPSAHYEDKVKKMPGGKLPQRSGLQMTVVNGYHSTEGILKRNEKSEAADDVPLQSGIVRIFKQPGIETPSDEDDFIEVKTRRQIREQRDKEMKAKSKDMKPKDQAARRYRPPVKSAVQGDEIPAISHRGATSSGGEKRNSMIPSAAMVDFVPIDGRNLPIAGSSASLIASAAPLQQLAPIGTPAANSEGSNDKRSISSKLIQTSPAPTISHVDADMGKVVRFENQSPVQDGISSTGVGAWGSTRTSQQVVSLTQIQLEEAMKPVSFEAKRAPLLPLGDHGSMALESGLSVISVLAQDKPLSSAAPLNSLLAGEKIQFGAVTSPTLLPPSSCSIMPPVSIGLGPSVACRPDGSMESAFSASEGDSTNFFSKADDRCRQMVDPEAEAEAAASAVAVAAISSDDSTGNGLGGVSRSVSESKAFVNSDVGASSVGVSATRPVMIQSRGEDSMTVALPADLSVETPSPLSLWPSVASRQNSAGPVLSHFPGAPPPFPCFEMSPMMGGPIFAFGQHEEAPSLSQGQKSNTSVEQGISGIGAGPVGGWQQCHSGVDSFYGAPPSGYTGPFISPPGGIPGMQGPPPMFVYNPFPAVGQFGQVGFMSAYIPSGKQPDWKHTPASTSGVGLNEGDISSLGIMSGQRNPNMPTPVQHMPIVPSLGLFDMNLSSPFQSAVDLPMQTQWSHVPGPPTFQTMPMSGSMVGLSMPLQQTDGLSSQFNHPSHTIESGGSRFHQVLASKTPGSGPFSTVDAAAQFPDELGLGDSVSSNNSSVLTSRNLSSNNVNYNSLPSANVKVQKGKSSSRSARSSSTGSGSESSALALGTNHVTSNNQSLHGSHTVGHPFQTQVSTSQTTSGQYPHPVGYSEQRGMSQQHTGHKMSVASEWSAQGHRKIGGQGRSQISGDKNFTTSKMKQVYVVKPSSSTSNMGTPVTLL